MNTPRYFFRAFAATLLAITVSLLASACFSPWSGGGEGSVTLAFAPPAPSGRAFTPLNEPEPARRHVVTLQGPRGTITHEFTGPGPERIAVLSGTWTVSVRAYGWFPSEGFDHVNNSFQPTTPLRAISLDAAVVEVVVGETTTASITMTHAAEVSTYEQLNGVLNYASDNRGMEKVIILAQSFEITEDLSVGEEVGITLVSDAPVTITAANSVADSMFSVGADGTLRLGTPGMAGSITLDGAGQARIIEVAGGTLEMHGGVTLTGGNTNNNGGGVFVDESGEFIMHGGAISESTANSGGGVFVDGGEFTMHGGAISDNTATSGGGVFVDGGEFTMHGGAISDNTANFSGGVSVLGATSTFTMYGGTISSNEADFGGGVEIEEGTFTMHSGTIYGNTAEGNGGGVTMGGEHSMFTMHGGTIANNVAVGTGLTNGHGGGVLVGTHTMFEMHGGTISGNTAEDNGGGVFVGAVNQDAYGTFYMAGGVIYGENAAGGFANTASGDGEAIYVMDGATAQYGTFNNGTFSNMGDLQSTDDTIRVVSGVLLVE
ncbi:MAG: hypothetical protein FWC64_09560 [Treponema sp.]|nr:hypothetical protein [Treponema sp.]